MFPQPPLSIPHRAANGAGPPHGWADLSGAVAEMGAWRCYFRDPEVFARMCEFLGGRSPRQATCRYLVRPSPSVERPFAPATPVDLPQLLLSWGEVARSLWDDRWLIVDLDVEHVHFDRPGDPLLRRHRSWTLQRPVAAAIEGLLTEYGIDALHFLSGRGHHWTWAIDRRSAAFQQLTQLGHPTPELIERYSRPWPPAQRPVGIELGCAYAGLGKVVELLGHRVLDRCPGNGAIPVELTAANVAPGPEGREAISIDLSLFGDPLDRRAVRLPFTPYLKGRRLGVPAPLIAVVVPPGEEDRAFLASSDPEAARRLAGETSAVIPDASAATGELLRDYLGSPLAEFHRSYYSWEIDPRSSWPATYDRLDLDSLPPCVGRILGQPNDLLLQPAALQLVVRTLLAAGWVPRHVAGLVQSRLEANHGWIPRIHFHDPGCRADFYVRMFSGLALLRPHDLTDFDCPSTQGKQLCPEVPCDCRLEQARSRLQAIATEVRNA